LIDRMKASATSHVRKHPVRCWPSAIRGRPRQTEPVAVLAAIG
jgi:hypothetical protein